MFWIYNSEEGEIQQAHEIEERMAYRLVAAVIVVLCALFAVALWGPLVGALRFLALVGTAVAIAVGIRSWADFLS